MLSAKETAELHNLLGDIDERAGQPRRRRRAVSAGRAHGADRGAPVRLGQQPAAASRVRFRRRGVRRGRQAPSEVGEAARRPGNRSVLARASTRMRSGRFATLRISRRPIRARTSFSARCTASSPELGGEIAKRLARFVKAQPKNALAHFHYAMTLWKGQPAGSPPADTRPVEAHLRRAVALDPKLAKGFLELGILLSDQQRYKEAILQLRSAVRVRARPGAGALPARAGLPAHGPERAGREGARDLRAAQGPIPLTRH